MRALAIIVLALAVAACGGTASKTQGNEAAGTDASQEGVGLVRSHEGKPAPDAAFKDPDGEEIALADFEGRPLLVNLWASWCVPCVKELPTLDRLAKSAGSDGLQVVAISQDMAPHPSVVAFLDKHKIATLEPFHDPGMRLSGALDAQILPTSILYDAQGKEVWRYVGDLDWTSAEAVKLLAEADAGGGS